tara:strand:+ start:1037 stop:2098 length:1062 start_codon:yes stop_codon:yes gene_type:complete
VFDVVKLLGNVFHPQAGERLVVVADHPHGTIPDDPLWEERRQMASEWREALAANGDAWGIDVGPLVTYPAVGAHNGNLPLDAGDPVPLGRALADASICVALSEFSPTAPMVDWSKNHPDFRCATLPGVARRTESTALAADYAEVARRCQILKDRLDAAHSADVRFSTGHEWHVDLRYRPALMDDGQLPRDKEGRVINLPSGESFLVPYEGEREGEASRTEGEIPVLDGDRAHIYSVSENRIVGVGGDGADTMNAYFAEDPARANIAEFAFGCNPDAVVWGNVLEDEKAGFHWAYGRSEHLDGTVGPGAFKGPETIVHQDIVYARECPIQVASVVLSGDAGDVEVIREGEYTLF